MAHLPNTPPSAHQPLLTAPGLLLPVAPLQGLCLPLWPCCCCPGLQIQSYHPHSAEPDPPLQMLTCRHSCTWLPAIYTPNAYASNLSRGVSSTNTRPAHPVKTLSPHQLGGGGGGGPAQRGTSLQGRFTQPSVCEPRPGRKGTQGTPAPKEFPGLTKHKADSGKCRGRVTKIKPYRSSELKVSICPVTEPHFPFPSQCHRRRKTLSFSTRQ